MTPEAMRIAIAEACGWKLSEPVIGHDGRWRKHAYRGKSVYSLFDSSWAGGPHDVIDDWNNAPDYLRDLNAMHEAEKTLPKSQRLSYDAKLGALCEETDSFTHHATAAQRCEAFLRTIGKWVDSEVGK